MPDKARAAQRKMAAAWLGRAGVVWLDVGEKITGGQPTGRIAVRVGVIKKRPLEQLASHEIIPSEVDGVPTDVIEVGRIVARDPLRHRPAGSGHSVGHVSVTAGTLGLVGSLTHLGSPAILSNSHVLAMQNLAGFGDPIVQPGLIDGGRVPADMIATFHRAAWIQFERLALPNPLPLGYVSQGYPNVVDAAVGASAESLVTRDVGTWGPVTGLKPAAVRDLVKKLGRTTGETHGQILGVSSDVIVDYGGPIARFQDQITISPGSFSAGGDSGSLIVAEESPLSAVGLLFAGSPSITIANKIDVVMAVLGFSLDTPPTPTPPFSDIEGHWAQAVIEEMAALGVVEGYPDNTFKPDQFATRAEICAMLSRLKAVMGG